MSESTKKVMWASTTPLTAPVGRSAGTPRKHTRIIHAPPLRILRARVAAALLLIGAALQVAAIFPAFGSAGAQFPTYNLSSLDGPALSSSLAAILQQVVPVAPWLVAAALVAAGTAPLLRAGLALAAGTVGLTAALRLFVLAQVVHSGAQVAKAGAWMALGGALIGLLALAVATHETSRSWNLGRLLRPASGRLTYALVAAAALSVASAFGWVAYAVDITGSNAVHASNQLAGAFENPWPVMVAEVILILLVGALAVTAVAWPGRAAAALALGLALALLGQVAGAVVRLHNGISVRQVGITASALTQQGITRAQVHLSARPDKWLWVAIGAIAAFAVLAAYLAIRPEPAPEQA